ncbi:MAG: NAD(P)H-hydrate dehydratase [Nitrososphaeria archaeon]|nr:NAD(P)H-hydrate dehydratase [Nitrososphaeria archaeon]
METVKEVTKELVQKFISKLKFSNIIEDNTVLIVGGSWLHHGPPFLAASSALKTGLVKVYLAAPKTLSTVFRVMSSDIIVLPLPDMKFTKGCARKLLKWMPTVGSILLGPGLGKGCRDGLEVFLKETKNIPLILVDDALHYDTIRLLNNKKHLIILKANEFPRLFNTTLPENVEEKISMVTSKVKEIKVTIYLKDNLDIISDGETTLTYNPNLSQPLMYGSLSVLAGITSAFSTVGLSSIESAAISSYINGKIHSLIYQEKGKHYTSSELIEYIQIALKEIL